MNLELTSSTLRMCMRGEAEKVVGKALSKYDRSSYVLATKVFGQMGDGPNDSGLSRKHIMEQCHASLKRLGTDYVDIYYCHRFHKETPQIGRAPSELQSRENLVCRLLLEKKK